MAKGENIFKRKDGRWEARYVKGYDCNGKVKYGFCYGKTYREAKEKVATYKAAVVNGLTLPMGTVRHPFGDYCEQWLLHKKSAVRESTYIKYENILKKHLIPKLGNRFPMSLNGAVIHQFTNELLYEDHLSVKTVHDILVVLRSVLEELTIEYPGQLPRIKIVYPKERKKEMRVLTRQEQQVLVSYFMENLDCCKFGLLLALYTGLRVGELCALQWKHIVSEERIIRVVATMQRLRDVEKKGGDRTRIVIGEPKSDTSVRVIPMTRMVAGLCQRMYCDNPRAYVLTGTESYMEPRTLQYRMKKYTQICGLEGVHCHTLRHTFATRAVEAGFEIKSLSEVLGHATTTITLERYVHSSVELKRANMDKLAKIGF